MDYLKSHKHTVITHAIISFYYIWITKILSHLFYVSNLATVLHFVLYQIFRLFSSKCVFLITFVHTFQDFKISRFHISIIAKRFQINPLFELFSKLVCFIPFHHLSNQFLNPMFVFWSTIKNDGFWTESCSSQRMQCILFFNIFVLFLYFRPNNHTITFSKSHTPPKTTFPVVVPRDKTVNSQVEASWRSYPGDGVTRWPRCPPGTIITASMWPNCTSRGPAALNHRRLCFP